MRAVWLTLTLSPNSPRTAAALQRVVRVVLGCDAQLSNHHIHIQPAYPETLCNITIKAFAHLNRAQCDTNAMFSLHAGGLHL